MKRCQRRQRADLLAGAVLILAQTGQLLPKLGKLARQSLILRGKLRSCAPADPLPADRQRSVVAPAAKVDPCTAPAALGTDESGAG